VRRAQVWILAYWLKARLKSLTRAKRRPPTTYYQLGPTLKLYLLLRLGAGGLARTGAWQSSVRLELGNHVSELRGAIFLFLQGLFSGAV
jgi:hypothetical protein